MVGRRGRGAAVRIPRGRSIQECQFAARVRRRAEFLFVPQRCIGGQGDGVCGAQVGVLEEVPQNGAVHARAHSGDRAAVGEHRQRVPLCDGGGLAGALRALPPRQGRHLYEHAVAGASRCAGITGRGSAAISIDGGDR